MKNTQKKIRIVPSDAPEFVKRVRETIIDTITNSPDSYSAVADIRHFREISGTVKDTITGDDCEFVVKYKKSVSHDKYDTLYVSYGNFEFDLSNSAETDKFFDDIKANIKNKYIYDLNSKQYVPRPVGELSFFQDVGNWLKSKFKGQKAK